jgi:hypothetical protein
MTARPLAPELPVAVGTASCSGRPAGSPRLQRAFWLALTVAVCLGFALRVSRPALLNPLVVHDDVRQHVFWVPRLHDPSLFAGDWIADYYEAQAPPAYRAVYWLATLAVDAVQASKLLPFGLTVVLAAGAFALGQALWGRSDAAALGAVLLSWSAWQYDDVASATPRAYAMPLLTVQLALLAADRWRLALAMLPLEALFYPLGCAVAVVTIGLWAAWRARGALRRALPELLGLGAATLVALGLVWLGQLDAARYGPTVSAAEARTMPEFQPGGRASYFVPNWYQFWLESSRSGFALGPKDALLFGLPALTIPFGLAMLLGCWLLAGRLGWMAPPRVPRSGALLLALLGGSLLLFAAAHALLFRLYLPARHVQFSLPLVWALAGGLCWALLGDRLAARFGSPERPSTGRWTGLAGAELFAPLAGIALLVLHPPPTGDFYVVGRFPAIYAYLRQTPPDTLVAALPGDSNILPLFGQRPILTSYEHALPYQPGYYQPLHARTEAFRAAYYAPTLGPLAEVIAEHGVDLVIADVDLLARRRRTEREQPPALERLLDRCGVLRERELVMLPAACIQAAALAP